MNDFDVSLAGIPIGISAIYPSTRSFFREYLSDEAPAFRVSVAERDIAFERVRSAIQDEKDGLPPRSFSDRYLETLAVLRKIADLALDYDTVLFHGSVVAFDGKAYLFAAPSGTGKTTHTRLWLDLLPEAYVLNGDKPFLRIQNGRVLACGTPWRGKEQLGCSECLPLEAICFLERGGENRIAPISCKEALEPMLQQVYRPERDDGMLKALHICGRIGNCVRLYRLKCNIDPEAAVVSSGVMLARE